MYWPIADGPELKKHTFSAPAISTPAGVHDVNSPGCRAARVDS